jgi:hypothetical protein
VAKSLANWRLSMAAFESAREKFKIKTIILGYVSTGPAVNWSDGGKTVNWSGGTWSGSGGLEVV